MAHYYGDEHIESLDFSPTFPVAFPYKDNRATTAYRLPHVTKNYSDSMAYDSHGYIYNTMSGLSDKRSYDGTTIATEEIEFEYPDEPNDDRLTRNAVDMGIPYSHTPAAATTDAIYPVKRHLPAYGTVYHQHHNSKNAMVSTNSSASSQTASTWLNETTYASTSLLDTKEEDDSWSSASATTSVLPDGEDTQLGDEEDEEEEEDQATSAYSIQEDDTTTYMENSTTPISLVESFLDELAENESVQRFSNFLLGSSVCQGRYNSSDEEEEEEEIDDYDDGDDKEYPDGKEVVSRQGHRGRSRSPRKQYPALGASSLRSFQSMADSIFEVRQQHSSQEKSGTTRKKKKNGSKRVFFAC